MTTESKPGRALVLRSEHVPIDRSKSDALLERARARIGVAKSAAVAALPAPGIAKAEIVKPSIPERAFDQVLIAMTCSARGKGFTARAARSVDAQGVQVLELLGGDELPAAEDVAFAEAGKLSGEYRIIETVAGWHCPLCHCKFTWTCRCSRFAGALHCGGSLGGETRYCACGRIEDRHLHEIDLVEVRGHSLGARSSQTVGGLPAVRSTGFRTRDR